MNTPTLTPNQTAMLAAEVNGGRLQVVNVDSNKATLFLAQASDGLSALNAVKSHSVRYSIAYIAIHDIGESLLAARGFRTASGPGQHVHLAKFLSIIFDGTSVSAFAATVDRLRQARNDLHYNAKPIGQAQADYAAQTAQALYSQILRF